MEILVIICLIVVSLAIIIFVINKKFEELKLTAKPENDLVEFIKFTNNRIDNATQAVMDVNKSIGEMSEIGRSIKDFSEFLQSPKLRGNVGEQILNQILQQNMPKNSFNLQYAFRNGTKVDVAIKTTAGIIPVDSKFPLTNFKKMMKDARYENEFVRDVKRHIDDIAQKYINVSEGTIDYALMYVSSEAVYFEIANNEDLFNYAQRKKVLPVSPTTFYAYMRAILMSFEGQKINEKTKEILATLKDLQNDYQKVESDLGVLQKHLAGAFNKMNDVYSSFGKLGRKIDATKNLEEK